METSELIRKVRKIEIKTRGLTTNIFAGEYQTAFKGKGMAFSEVREYQYGDDVRNIDWNVTARFNHPFIKVFEEERELTVVLLIDVSGSRDFGSEEKTKKNIITEVSAILSFSAIQNNDRIGVIFFSDKVEKFIPPKKGRGHILYIIRELINFTPQSSKTDISEALKYFNNAIKKRSTAFLISDFLDYDADFNPRFYDSLKVASSKHDVVSLRVFDKREYDLPNVGIVQVKDAESGKIIWVNTSSKKKREAVKENFMAYNDKINSIFTKCGVDKADIDIADDYVKPLVKLFKKR